MASKVEEKNTFGFVNITAAKAPNEKLVQTTPKTTPVTPNFIKSLLRRSPPSPSAPSPSTASSPSPSTASSPSPSALTPGKGGRRRKTKHRKVRRRRTVRHSKRSV